MLHQNQAKIESPRQKNNESKEIDAMLPTMKFYFYDRNYIQLIVDDNKHILKRLNILCITDPPDVNSYNIY